MKLTKQEVCVFIDNEAQLQGARELLERYNQEIFWALFDLWGEYLHYNDISKEWWITDFETKEFEGLETIALSELEEILKVENDGI